MFPMMASLGLDKLPLNERAALADELRDSVEAERGPTTISEEFRAELLRRAEDAELHPETGIPWEEVNAKVQAKYGGPLTKSQADELDRRVAEDDADPDDLMPWEQVKAEARARHLK